MAGVRLDKTPDFTSVDVTSIAIPIVDRYAERALQMLKDQWPVASGRSRDSWQVATSVSGESWEIAFVATVDYAKYVKPAGSPDSAPLIDTLTEKIMAELAPLLDAEIESAVAGALSRATTSARGR